METGINTIPFPLQVVASLVRFCMCVSYKQWWNSMKYVLVDDKIDPRYGVLYEASWMILTSSEDWEPLIRQFVVAFLVSHTQLLLRLEHLLQASGMECQDSPVHWRLAWMSWGNRNPRVGGRQHLHAQSVLGGQYFHLSISLTLLSTSPRCVLGIPKEVIMLEFLTI